MQAGMSGGEMSGGMGISPGGNSTAGDVDVSSFDPMQFLRDFDYRQTRREGGRTVRENTHHQNDD